MAEREIVDFLRSRPNQKFSTKELSEKLDINVRIVRRNVDKLDKYNVFDVTRTKNRNNKTHIGFFTLK